VRRNDEVAAQSRSERDRWTFYETIKFGSNYHTEIYESIRIPRIFPLDNVWR